ITDDQNNILGIPPSNSQNFEGAGSGVCRVWGLSYTGNITAGMGDNATAVPLTDGCFELSENFIEVIRDTPDGGTVSTPDGATEVSVCAGDGIDDLVGFQHVSSSMAAYRYVITDDQNIILGTPPPGATEVNFDGAGPGVCRIWGLSYTGMFMGEMGDDAAAIDLSNDCFELSSNFITVIRTEVDGGTVSMPSGATVRYTCPGDGVDDVIMFVHENDAPGTEYAYVITDDQNNILGIPPSNSQNFEGAGSGVCRVWGLSYTGSITAGMGDNATAVPLTDGCFELSENFIEVIRDTPDGGTVSTTDDETEVTICAGDGDDDIISVQHETSSMAAFRYIVTDDQNNILATPPAGTTELNLEGAGPGICRIWGLSFTGMFAAEVGQNAGQADLSSDCFELSENFVTVIRVDSGAPCDGNFAPPVVGNQNFQGLNLPSAIQGLNLSPNPVVADLNLQFEHNGLAQRYQIAVFNTAGQLITEQVYEANDGSNTYELDLQQAEPGFYILQMVGEDGNRMSRKFIKSIK
ncbi:MAG: T9SS type A sorting domain-containing protein, partial [Bacteroidota bacterium]